MSDNLFLSNTGLDLSDGIPTAINWKSLRDEMISKFRVSRNAADTCEKKVNECNNCGKISANLLSCSRCKTVNYCDRDCQRAAWPMHKASCQGDSAAAASISTNSKTWDNLLQLQCAGCPGNLARD